MEEINCTSCNTSLHKKQKFGFSNCYPTHVFCYKCREKISADELNCPYDKLIVDGVTKNRVTTNADYQHIDLITHTKLFSSKVARSSIVNSTGVEPETISSRCVVCLNDFYNELSFGLSGCFPHHRFCFGCITKISPKNLKCPIDLITSESKVGLFNKCISNREELFFIALKFFSNRADDRSQDIMEEIQFNGEVGQSVCCGCFRYYANESIFGFTKCFPRHTFCFGCIMQLNESSKKCPLDNELDLVVEKSVSDVLTIVKSRHLDLLTLIKSNKSYKRRLPVSEVNKTQPTEKCGLCSEKHIEGELVFGLSNCFMIHTFCFYCIKTSSERSLFCPLDKMLNQEIVIFMEDVMVKVDRYHIDMMDQVRETKGENNSRWILNEIRTCCQIGLAPSSCSVCSKDITIDPMFGIPECMDHHMFCHQCMQRNIDAGLHCPIDQINNPQIKSIVNNLVLDIDQHYFSNLRYLQTKKTAFAKQLIDEMTVTSSFRVDVCVGCLRPVVADRYMFGLGECVTVHRMCLECTAPLCSDKGGFRCVIGHTSASPLSAVMATSIDFNETFPVDPLFFKTYLYLRHKSTPQSMNLSLKLRDNLRDPMTCLSTICIACLCPIINASFGFQSCHAHHIFCQNCVTLATFAGDLCPVDGVPNQTIVKRLQANQSVTTLECHYFRIMDYLTKGAFNKDRTKMLREMLYKTSFFPDNACIMCLSTVRVVDGTVQYRCSFKHLLCAVCRSRSDVNSVCCPIDNHRFL